MLTLVEQVGGALPEPGDWLAEEDWSQTDIGPRKGLQSLGTVLRWQLYSPSGMYRLRRVVGAPGASSPPKPRSRSAGPRFMPRRSDNPKEDHIYMGYGRAAAGSGAQGRRMLLTRMKPERLERGGGCGGGG